MLTALVNGQTKLDSQLAVIKDKPDTAKIRILCNFCFNNRVSSPKLALESGEMALDLARKISNKSLETLSCNVIGRVYRILGDYDKSLTYFMDARRIAEENKDSVNLAHAENNIGGNYWRKSYYSLALVHILNGLRIFERYNDQAGKAFCLINIGAIYRRLNNYTKALEYFELAYKIRKEIGDKSGAAAVLASIADLNSDQNNYQKALEYYNMAEEEYTAVGDKSDLALVWSGKGNVFFKQKDYNNAIKYHTNSLNLSRQISGNERQILSENNLGIIYAHSGRFNEGEKYLNRAFEDAQKIKDNYLVLNCYKAFSDYYEIKKDLRNSLKYLNMYIALKDTIEAQKNIASIAELEAIYKNEKISKENVILLKDKEMSDKQRIYWIIFTAFLIVSSFILYARFLLKKRANNRLKEINVTKDKFFGIISHDLKNPFNSIFGATEILLNNFNSQTDEEKLRIIKEIENSAKQTYKLLENLLYWSRAQAGIIAFNPKALIINDIIKETISLLDNTANNKNIKLSLEISEIFQVYCDEEMIKTVIRNLISNGIKFTNEGGTVTIILKKAGNYIEIAIVDSGIGMSPKIKDELFKIDKIKTLQGTSGEKGTGLGLILCKEFVEKNKGKIWVESIPGEGSRFIFTIPSIIK
jgi:signal transduction histidine kinase